MSEEIGPGWVPAYSPNQFTTLCEEVDRQGGAVLPDTCVPELLKFPKPQSDKVDLAETCHCYNESMAVVTYDPSDTDERRKKMAERGAGFARVCLVCDAAGLWPRFDKALEGVV